MLLVQIHFLLWARLQPLRPYLQVKPLQFAKGQVSISQAVGRKNACTLQSSLHVSAGEGRCQAPLEDERKNHQLTNRLDIMVHRCFHLNFKKCDFKIDKYCHIFFHDRFLCFLIIYVYIYLQSSLKSNVVFSRIHVVIYFREFLHT